LDYKDYDPKEYNDENIICLLLHAIDVRQSLLWKRFVLRS